MMRTLTLATALIGAISLPALAQGTTTTTPVPDASRAAPTSADLVLTADQAKSWIGKPVYSSDGKNLGEVSAFARGADNKVGEMHADIGGFLGIGETRVRLMPRQFKLSGDRATLEMTAAQAKDLPRVQ